MFCPCCQTRILRDEVDVNNGRCPECGTVPDWISSSLWDENVVDDEEMLYELEDS